MTVTETFSRVPRFSGVRNASAIVATVLIHVAALLSIFQTEYGLLATTLALLTWAFLNFFWLAVLRRPAVSAALSLMIMATLMVLSQFKFNILEMVISFLDFLIVDVDTA